MRRVLFITFEGAGKSTIINMLIQRHNYYYLQEIFIYFREFYQIYLTGKL